MRSPLARLYRWSQQHDPAPNYASSEPFAWALARSRRRLRLAGQRNLLAAFGCSVAGMLVAATYLRHDSWPPAAVIAGYLLLAGVHLLIAWPAQAWGLALAIGDDLRGSGASEGRHLQLLAIPDLPRPLYFHLWRAALAPFLPNRLAPLFLATGFAWLAAPSICLGAFHEMTDPPQIRPALPAGIDPVADRFAGALSGALLAGIAACALGLPALAISRGAVAAAAGTAGGLGAAARLALDPFQADDAALAEAGARIEMDEDWAASVAEGAPSWALDAAKGVVCRAGSVLLYGGAWVGSFAAAAMATGAARRQSRRELDDVGVAVIAFGMSLGISLLVGLLLARRGDAALKRWAGRSDDKPRRG